METWHNEDEYGVNMGEPNYFTNFIFIFACIVAIVWICR